MGRDLHAGHPTARNMCARAVTTPPGMTIDATAGGRRAPPHTTTTWSSRVSHTTLVLCSQSGGCGLLCSAPADTDNHRLQPKEEDPMMDVISPLHRADYVMRVAR